MLSQTYSNSKQGSSVSGFHDAEQSLSAITVLDIELITVV
jgi:hypothetical protein